MDKRAARTAYKERKPAMGVFAVRCSAAERVWVGAAQNLDAARNRIWFTAENVGGSNRQFTNDWRAFGAGAFEFEILEKFDPEEALRFPADRLKERAAHWRRALGADAI